MNLPYRTSVHVQSKQSAIENNDNAVKPGRKIMKAPLSLCCPSSGILLAVILVVSIVIAGVDSFFVDVEEVVMFGCVVAISALLVAVPCEEIVKKIRTIKVVRFGRHIDAGGSRSSSKKLERQCTTGKVWCRVVYGLSIAN